MTTTTKTQIWKLGALEIASAIKNKEISCEETMISHLEHIKTVNGKINAISVILQNSALEAARDADRLIASGKTPPPLLGVPFTVKKNIDCEGSATTFAVKILKNARPQADAPHIKNLKNAGAIILGRTNMPDLGMRLHTDNDLYGATLNPWDTSRTPGGSSGGDAAAVATGMTPLGIGNDYGGSLRQPACFCGVTTICPSIGRIPDYMSLLPAEPAVSMQLFMVQGPIARKVSDLLPVLQIMSQFDPRDPHWIPAPFLNIENWVDLHPDCGHTGYMAGFAMRKAIAREWSLFQQKYPLILGPVVGTQPFKIDTDINSKEEFKKILKGYPLSMAANVLGLPAVALPVGIANDLPQGVQLVGPRYYECLCLDAAQVIEDCIGKISTIDI